MTTLQDFSIQALQTDGDVIAGLNGQVVLAVNVASKCGLTPHYTGLQKLYAELGEQGFVVVGFPCNQFGAQEPGTPDEIADFCETNYSVTFPLTEKIHDQVLSLPLSPVINQEEQDYVIEILNAFNV